MKIGEIWYERNRGVPVKITNIVFTTPEKDTELDCLGTIIDAAVFTKNKKMIEELSDFVDELYKDDFVSFVFVGDSEKRESTIPRKMFLKLFKREK